MFGMNKLSGLSFVDVITFGTITLSIMFQFCFFQLSCSLPDDLPSILKLILLHVHFCLMCRALPFTCLTSIQQTMYSTVLQCIQIYQKYNVQKKKTLSLTLINNVIVIRLHKIDAADVYSCNETFKYVNEQETYQRTLADIRHQSYVFRQAVLSPSMVKDLSHKT